MDGRVYVEDWQAHYGTPLHIDVDVDVDVAARVDIVEDSPTFAIAPVTGELPGRLAFVDAVRRGDAYLYLEDAATGALVHGVAAAAHARGAALCDGGRLRCDRIETTRLVIWGGGSLADLPDVRGGFSWRSRWVQLAECVGLRVGPRRAFPRASAANATSGREARGDARARRLDSGLRRAA